MAAAPRQCNTDLVPASKSTPSRLDCFSVLLYVIQIHELANQDIRDF